MLVISFWGFREVSFLTKQAMHVIFLIFLGLPTNLCLKDLGNVVLIIPIQMMSSLSTCGAGNNMHASIRRYSGWEVS